MPILCCEPGLPDCGLHPVYSCTDCTESSPQSGEDHNTAGNQNSGPGIARGHVISSGGGSGGWEGAVTVRVVVVTVMDK